MYRIATSTPGVVLTPALVQVAIRLGDHRGCLTPMGTSLVA
jgi:hypothetical protein